MLTPVSCDQKYSITKPTVHGANGVPDCPLWTRLGRLSPRQKEAVELAASGRTNKQIALAMDITVDTVRVHLRIAMGLLELRRRQHLAPLGAYAAAGAVFDFSSLTPREIEIAAQVAAGAMDKEIVERFDLTESDVKTAIRRIRRAAGGGTRTRAAVVFLAARRSVTLQQGV